MSDSLQPHGLQAVRILCPWNAPGQNTGVGSCSLLQWIFKTQGSNPGLLNCRWILYQLSHVGSYSESESHPVFPILWDPMDYALHEILPARILEWVVIPFSRGSSLPRDRTQVSYTAGRFFTSWATRKAQKYWSGYPLPSPADFPDSGVELGSPELQTDSLPDELPGKVFYSTLTIKIENYFNKAWVILTLNQKSHSLSEDVQL